MRLMGGAAVESGVVGVLFGVGERGKSKSKVKIPGLGQKLGLAGESPFDFAQGRSAPTQSKATPTATPTAKAADEGVRATPTAKRLGERAEAAFLAKASGLGFGVAKPWGDSDRYDFIVDAGGKLRRVQVKSAHRVGADGGYSLRLFGHSVGAYKEDEIDFLVCYLAPEDAWYVFPPEVFLGRRSVKLFGGSVRRRSKFEVYREGWWRLGTSKPFTTENTEFHRGKSHSPSDSFNSCH